MVIAMAFLFFDGIQGACVGILKGLKDTKIIALTMLGGYVLIAIPLGCLLALHYRLNLIGFWYALIVSTIILCIIMFTNLLYRIKKMEN